MYSATIQTQIAEQKAPAMPLDIGFRQEADILIATVAGIYTIVDDEESDRRIAAKCQELGLQKALIDFRKVDGTPAVFELYNGGARLEERGFSRDMVLAFVDREEFRTQNDFYRLVARNRGFRVRHFYDMESALAWLRTV